MYLVCPECGGTHVELETNAYVSQRASLHREGQRVTVRGAPFDIGDVRLDDDAVSMYVCRACGFEDPESGLFVEATKPFLNTTKEAR